MMILKLKRIKQWKPEQIKYFLYDYLENMWNPVWNCPVNERVGNGEYVIEYFTWLKFSIRIWTLLCWILIYPNCLMHWEWRNENISLKWTRSNTWQQRYSLRCWKKIILSRNPLVLMQQRARPRLGLCAPPRPGKKCSEKGRNMKYCCRKYLEVFL